MARRDKTHALKVLSLGSQRIVFGEMTFAPGSGYSPARALSLLLRFEIWRIVVNYISYQQLTNIHEMKKAATRIILHKTLYCGITTT